MKEFVGIGRPEVRNDFKLTRAMTPLASFVVAIVLLSSANLALAASSQSPVLEGSRKASDMVLVIESDRLVYHSGDTINIRVGIRNKGPVDMGLVLSSPWVGSSLFVADASGKRLKPLYSRNQSDFPTTHGTLLAVGKTVYLEWEGRQYFNLDNWGI